MSDDNTNTTASTPMVDRYGQTLAPGQRVLWATGWSKGPRHGIVIKLCRHRVRIQFKQYWPQSQYRPSEWSTYQLLQQPSRLVVISEELPQILTLEALKEG